LCAFAQNLGDFEPADLRYVLCHTFYMERQFFVRILRNVAKPLS
jgi:hypothetical protein